MFPGGCYALFHSLVNWEGSEKLVAAAVRAVEEEFTELTVCISSVGGEPDKAFYAMNILRGLPLTVTTHNVGGVRSAANVLFMAGQRRYASPGSAFFFHETWFEGGQHNSTSVGKRLQSIQKDDDRSVAALARFTGQSEETVRDWHARDVTMSEAEAVKLGIAHAVKELVIPANAFVTRIEVS